jgi:hypothetical protein
MSNIDSSLESLADKTMFLKLDFKRFGNVKKVNLAIQSEANESRFKHQKKLLESPELNAITTRDAEVRAFVDRKCLPYDVGIRFAPNASVEEINTILSEYQNVERPMLVEAFISVYSAQVAQAQIELKEHFSGLNYPSEGEMRTEFSFSYQFFSFSVPGHLANIAPAIFAAEKEKAQKIMVEAANGVVEALCTTAHELVTHLLDRLSSDSDGKVKRLHKTAITDLTEFIKDFSTLNVTDHAGLANEINKLQQMLDGVDAEKIKHSDTLKTTLQGQLAAAAQSLGSLVEVKGRKFR